VHRKGLINPQFGTHFEAPGPGLLLEAAFGRPHLSWTSKGRPNASQGIRKQVISAKIVRKYILNELKTFLKRQRS
jgi:hypothetical protein